MKVYIVFHVILDSIDLTRWSCRRHQVTHLVFVESNVFRFSNVSGLNKEQSSQQPLLFGAVEPGWFSVLRMLWLQRQSCICTPWSASPGGPGSPACEAVEVSQEMIWMNFEVQSFAHFEFWCRSYVVCGDVRILQFGQEIWGVEIAALSAWNTTLAAGAGACGAFLHSFLGGVEGTVAAKLQAPSS